MMKVKLNNFKPNLNVGDFYSEEEKIVRSALRPYCPECDHLFKREQVLYFREHCRVMHDWLWCSNWYKGDGCEFATTCKEELELHMQSCPEVT